MEHTLPRLESLLIHKCERASFRRRGAVTVAMDGYCPSNNLFTDNVMIICCSKPILRSRLAHGKLEA